MAGQRGREVMLVLAGRAVCLVGDERPVAVFGPGSFFGEIAALDGGTRTATVSALLRPEGQRTDARSLRGSDRA